MLLHQSVLYLWVLTVGACVGLAASKFLQAQPRTSGAPRHGQTLRGTTVAEVARHSYIDVSIARSIATAAAWLQPKLCKLCSIVLEVILALSTSAWTGFKAAVGLLPNPIHPLRQLVAPNSLFSAVVYAAITAAAAAVTMSAAASGALQSLLMMLLKILALSAAGALAIYVLCRTLVYFYTDMRAKVIIDDALQAAIQCYNAEMQRLLCAPTTRGELECRHQDTVDMIISNMGHDIDHHPVLAAFKVKFTRQQTAVLAAQVKLETAELLRGYILLIEGQQEAQTEMAFWARTPEGQQVAVQEGMNAFDKTTRALASSNGYKFMRATLELQLCCEIAVQQYIM